MAEASTVVGASTAPSDSTGPFDFTTPAMTPDEAVEALTDPTAPYLIGVRHHAPSLAAVMPELLDAAKPEVLLVELPADLQEWLPWLAHADTRAPVALAAVPAAATSGGDGRGPAFYPFADFSPELVALRWAARHGIPVIACDLPLSDQARHEPRHPAAAGHDGPGLREALTARLTGRPGEDLWDRLVETAAPGSPPEALRRAALLTGWALRHDAERAGAVAASDLARERWMRARIHEATAAGRRAAVVVGAFHTPALLGPGSGPVPPADAFSSGPAWTVSLIPYTYPLLDERSGYPAGIRDPEWQHLVLEAAGRPAAIDEALLTTAVRICGELRAQDHPSGPADAREIVRLAGDLARLRGLPAPGRGELIEAVQTVLAQGEPLGRGRAVARSLERVLVGTRSGRPAPAAPRSGLAPAVEDEVAALGLPGPADTGPAARDLRLDPLRSDLDRRRELLLRRLTVCDIPYATSTPVTGAGAGEAVTTRWEVRWTPATAAMLTAAGVRGVTPAQAAEGLLRERRRAEQDDGGPTAAQSIDGLAQAAACGLPALADERLTELGEGVPATGTLPQLLAALGLLDRIRAGHIAGLGADPDRAARSTAVGELLTSAAVRQVDGLTGSDDPDDARALLELAHRADVFGGIRLTDALTRLAADGSPLMSAAAGAVRVLLGHEDAHAFGTRTASWVDAATDAATRTVLTARLTGLLTAAGPLLETMAPVLDPVLDRVTDLGDTAFLDRLPALRGGFDTLSPASRDRLLTAVEDRLGDAAGRVTDTDGIDPAALALWTRTDLAARATLDRLGLLPPALPAGPDGSGPSAKPHDRDHHPGQPSPALAAEPATPDPTGTPPHTPGRTPAPDAAAPAATAGPAAAQRPGPPPADSPAAPAASGGAAGQAAPTPDRVLAPADRWRLVLGRRTDQLPPSAAPLATALDELYGTGRGEGSRGDLGAGNRGGRQAPYPGVREWSEELSALFGPGIREEVLAAAAASGRRDVLGELDPDSVRPSVDLLRTVLQHAGGLPEARLGALRPLVRRLVDELTRQLATRLRPALTGMTLPRPSRRPGGRLDLARTLRANLATARRAPDGSVQVIPEHPVFRSRARRAADWRLVLVTDVSGSMEASTIWSALTAAVLAGVPTVSTHFLAFSTEVIDLTDHVHDPLSLLLEVRVGGGTHIAAGLRHARTLVTVPSRTLIVVISDFEEGHPVGGLLSEVRTLVGAGCHVLGCASLDDSGRPRYSTGVAGQLVAAGMPVAALSPLELARWVGEKIA
ncbi:vWA domain-containing protein [Streptomyces stoeckheimensis]|uniref:vWA domain-containing protein n=1 Tax=Streptomyces stoeckheimensis TaxID=3344656 RepID=UPI0038B3A47B